MIPVSLFIFDLDGTLVNTLEDIAASVNYTLTRLGNKPIALDAVKQYVGDGIGMLMARALGGNTAHLDDAVVIYKDHHRRNLVVNSSLYPTVRETLEHFRSVPMAVVSNKAMEFVGPVIDRLGMGQFFKRIIGADYGLPLKPAPDAFQLIMSEFKAPKERTVIVGDGTTDIRAGKAAGIITCSVAYGFRSEEELRKAEPDHIIHEFSDLKQLFISGK